MESTGQRQRIHCSQETADLLVTAGKSWTTARDEIVDAKGKGGMQTYWIEAIKTSTSSVRSRSESDDFSFDNGRKSMHKGNKLSSSTHDEKIGRLVDWNTDVFCGLVKQVLAYQDAFCKKTSQSRTQAHDLELNLSRTVVDEVVEIIELPQVMNKARTTNSNEDELEPAVVEQIRKYILAVALMYNDNPFHNFEHVRSEMRLSKMLIVHCRQILTLAITRSGFSCDIMCDKVNVSNCRSGWSFRRLHR